MLMKPRRWLAYSIEINDLLPQYSEIVDRFEGSDIPLDGAFGSNTEPGSEIPGLLVAIGPAVEPERLLEVIGLLDGLGQLFLVIHPTGEHSKVIYIGSLNLEKAPVVALTSELRASLEAPAPTSSSMLQAIESAPKVAVVS